MILITLTRDRISQPSVSATVLWRTYATNLVYMIPVYDARMQPT